ncbi:hypothetical protein N9X71_07885 [Paracoccus sp. (in: a-proteobacteria)]|nr:hypothetical protein [Paracoccus sp. (in: a-proteobacteria)]
MSPPDLHFSLLSEKLITVGHEKKHSLPGLFAAMSRGEKIGYLALRPHQRPAWHMFCVQLAALALWTGGRDAPPEDENTWRELLRGLTLDFPKDDPWCLVVEDRAKPAFLQPPDPGGLEWSPVTTPDALDMLITARNHDLKQQVMQQARPEDWLFALVSLQTMEGYNGQKNYGIARMNRGSSSRVMLSLAPQNGRTLVLDHIPWWRRDLDVLLSHRASGRGSGPCVAGGVALLWLVSWPEGAQMNPQDLDPWFIEVCRRIRLKAGNGLSAERAKSKAARTDATAFNGVLGDPWAPVHRTNGTTLTLGEGRLDYRRLHALLLGGEWELPACARPQRGEGDLLLVAEALSRGNSKTFGFQSRIVPIPGGVVQRLGAAEMKGLADQQLKDIADCDKVLRDALVLVAANGKRDAVKKEHYALTRPARAAFEARADEMFFPALWEAVVANDESAAALRAAQARFRARLREAAIAEFEAALPAIPCAAIFRSRAEARARRAFFGMLNKAGFKPVSEPEEAAHDPV